MEEDPAVVGVVGEGTAADVESGCNRTSRESKLGVCRAFPGSLETGD